MISLKDESRLLSLLRANCPIPPPPFSSEWGIATWRNFVWQDSLKCLLCLLWIFCTLCLYFDHFITDMIHLSLNKNLIIMCEVTCKRVYIPFCQSVGLSVGLSISLFVGPYVMLCMSVMPFLKSCRWRIELPRWACWFLRTLILTSSNAWRGNFHGHI